MAAHSEKSVQVLLEHGADPNRRNKEGFTALAIARVGDSPAIIRLLKQHGAKE
jgi:ankyrin repeat protein